MANKKKKNANNKYKNKNRKNNSSENRNKKQSSSSSCDTNNYNVKLYKTTNKANEDIFGSSDKTLRVEMENKCETKCIELNAINISDISNTMIKPHGLTNLGNTCYFNSVLQVLSQTHILYDLLNERSNSGVDWIAKAVNANYDFTQQLHTILPNCFSLNTSVIKTLREMRSNNGKVITPSHLLKEICNKWSQFSGYQQQDSHELLRCVLDSLKSEEIKRQRKAIIQALDLSDKISNYDDDTKAKCKSFAPYSSNTLIDSIFGGIMLASITCSECGNTSQNFEPFFDISLPIVEENSCLKSNKVQNNIKINEEECKDSGKCLIDSDSKTLTPKERKTKRQQKKAAKRTTKQQMQQKIKPEANNVNETNDTNSVNHNKTNGEVIEENPINSVATCSNFNETRDTNSYMNTCENQNCELSDDDWDIVPLFDDIIVSPTKNYNVCNDCNDVIVNDVKNNIEDCDVLNDDSFNLNILYETSNSNDNYIEEDEKTIDETRSNSDESDAQLCIAFDNMDGENVASIDSLAVDLSISDKEKLTRTHCENGSATEQMKSLIKSTLLSLSHKQNHTEYSEQLPNFSLINCLSKFTAEEMLVGSNKYICDLCTKNNGNVKKYCDASKQTLIAIPPPILTLHLKRFEADGYRKSNLRKINQFVSFPATFDLSPFISKIYNFITPLTKLKPAERIIYSLYGVIEHSGSLRSGHYTAFVKVRKTNTNINKFYLMQPFLHKIDYVLKLIEQNEFNITTDYTNNSNGDSAHENGNDFNGCNDDINEENSGKWYHISDSSVNLSSINSVLHSQAYILFYERIS